jgi:hypothetical protein
MSASQFYIYQIDFSSRYQIQSVQGVDCCAPSSKYSPYSLQMARVTCGRENRTMISRKMLMSNTAQFIRPAESLWNYSILWPTHAAYTPRHKDVLLEWTLLTVKVLNASCARSTAAQNTPDKVKNLLGNLL